MNLRLVHKPRNIIIPHRIALIPERRHRYRRTHSPHSFMILSPAQHTWLVPLRPRPLPPPLALVAQHRGAMADDHCNHAYSSPPTPLPHHHHIFTTPKGLQLSLPLTHAPSISISISLHPIPHLNPNPCTFANLTTTCNIISRHSPRPHYCSACAAPSSSSSSSISFCHAQGAGLFREIDTGSCNMPCSSSLNASRRGRDKSGL
ncbi:hypothetical protein M758_UG055600 [Ceratodon purpureus]|nr:hypothetical protein M758_UG055600 [Ceratodon purpureus]